MLHNISFFLYLQKTKLYNLDATINNKKKTIEVHCTVVTLGLTTVMALARYQQTDHCTKLEISSSRLDTVKQIGLPVPVFPSIQLRGAQHSIL